MSADAGNTILLVEDNGDDVFMMKRALKLAQITHPLQLVTHGQAALDYLSGEGVFADRNRYPLPFIVFLDLKLPYIHGFEILEWKRLRPELDSVVVVVLTSSAEEKDHQRAYALGARSFLVKPPTPNGLKEIFASLQSLWPAKSHSLPATPGQAR